MSHIFDATKLNYPSGSIVNGMKYYTYYDVITNYGGKIPLDCEYFHITNEQMGNMIKQRSLAYPQKIEYPSNLKILTIEPKILKSFNSKPITISKLHDSIEVIYMRDCRIGKFENLPTNLKYLDVSANRISKLPENPVNCLLYINISNNYLTELTDNYLPETLEYLDFSCNSLRNIPAKFPDNITILRLACVSSKSSVKNIEHNIKHLPNNLEKLDCHNSNIVSISHFPEKLKIIDISDNRKLYEIPQLPPNLIEFDAYNCKLSSFTGNIPDSVEKLEIGHNRFNSISNIPLSIKNFGISVNNITDLPDFPSNISQLVRIAIDSNPIKYISPHNYNILKGHYSKVARRNYQLNRLFLSDIKIHSTQFFNDYFGIDSDKDIYRNVEGSYDLDEEEFYRLIEYYDQFFGL